MCDRTEILEATLNVMDEGVAILDEDGDVLFWNKAAAAFTGYQAEELLGQRCPAHLYQVNEEHRGITGVSDPTCERAPSGSDLLQRPTLVSMSHKFGHSLPGMLRKIILRNSSGAPPGVALLFYPVEEVDALPHGECGEGREIERIQANMEDRLEAAYHQWITRRMSFGLLWVKVDQAESLRRTHGTDACEAMLGTVEQTLLRQMKPAEVLGRWGCNEFLVLSHERTPQLLFERAGHLVGLARTADFRWWGDRVGLSVSIGASQVAEDGTLPSLLHSARQAMQASAYAGGNQVTEARGT